MKNYIIELKINPHDEWKIYKKFNEPRRAIQSLKMLNKHRYNLFKEGDLYENYRLYDKLQMIYFK